MKNRLSITAICLVMLLALSCQNAPSDAAADAPIEARLQEVLRIGDDEEAGLEYLFAQPKDIATDSQGNIYVSDRTSVEIKVYDAAGTYLRSLGAQGQGPGEFTDVRAMFIAEDQVIISDFRGGRITKLSPEGAVLAIHPAHHELVGLSRAITALPDGQFVFSFLGSSTDRDQDNLLHVYTADFQEETAAFGPTHMFGDVNEHGYRQLAGSSPGSVWAEKEALYYVPKYYRGKIYIFEKEQEGWALSDSLSGHINQEKALTVYTGEDLEADTMGLRTMMISEGGRILRFGFAFHNESLGLWRLRNGHLVHFTFIQDGDERLFGVEIYDAENQWLGYGELERAAGQGARKLARTGKEPVWKDHNDVFYLIVGRTTIGAYTLSYTLPGA